MLVENELTLVVEEKGKPVVFNPQNQFHRIVYMESKYNKLTAPPWENAAEIIEVPDEEALADTEKKLPLVDFLTRPRSFTEFHAMREALYSAFLSPHVRNSPNSNLYYLAHLAVLFNIIPNIDRFVDEVKPSWVKKHTEVVKQVPFVNPKDKIIKESELENVCTDLASWEPHRIAVIGGKCRYGINSGHSDLIRQAKSLLGPYSTIIFLLETSNAITERRNQSSFPDDERSLQVASKLDVDKVVLVDPHAKDKERVKTYYEDLWRRAKAEYCLFGSPLDALTPVFIESSYRLGMIPLWARDKNGVSTTELSAYVTD
jgi:hypothetical protein